MRSHVVGAVFDFPITLCKEAGQHIGLFRGQMFSLMSFKVLWSLKGVLAMRTFVAVVIEMATEWLSPLRLSPLGDFVTADRA